MTFFLNKFIYNYLHIYYNYLHLYYNYLHKIENIKKDKYKALEIGDSWFKDLCV
jgi:hypothetical protein